MFATYSLRHSPIHAHAPRRVSCACVRRMCPKSRAAVGFQGSGFVPIPSVCVAPCRAALVASVADTAQPHSASVTAAAFSHAVAAIQALSLRLAHPRGGRRAQAALRCTIPSLPHALSQLVAQAPLHRPSPNCRWSGQAGSNVPQSTTVAACRSPKR